MTEPRTKAGRALGQLLGRHHRQLMVSGEKCSACRDYHPTPKEVRAAIEREAAQQERERIRAWLDGRIANADGPMAASAESLTFNGGRSAAFKEVRAILAEPSDE